MARLAFGMVLPVQAQSVLMAEAWEASGTPEDVGAVAAACEEHGLDHVSVCDHVAVPRELAATMGTTWYDPVATLGWLAARTSRIRLLSQVYVLPLRHPLQTSKAFSTLDALSGGRVILGVGLGHVVAEFELLGSSFASRASRATAAIGEIRSAFADEWGSGFGQAPRPVQPAGPPIWVGGSSAPARKRAAELGDGWLPQGPPEGGMTAAIREINLWRERAGRAELPFAMNAATALYVGQPPSEVGRCVSGEPDRLAEHLERLASIGATHVQIRLRSRGRDELVDQIAAFAGDVVPLLG